jgi:hypothetical protein
VACWFEMAGDELDWLDIGDSWESVLIFRYPRASCIWSKLRCISKKILQQNAGDTLDWDTTVTHNLR